ncbi:MAG: hypothetical protein GTO18_05550 [Anaerolineales bacterium]|nr:hypothetical protein [Anaerolineales bacterium]
MGYDTLIIDGGFYTYSNIEPTYSGSVGAHARALLHQLSIYIHHQLFMAGMGTRPTDCEEGLKVRVRLFTWLRGSAPQPVS